MSRITDTGVGGCNFSYDGTDCGYNVDTTTGEIAHLFHEILGNISYYDTSGNGPQSGYGLQNTSADGVDFLMFSPTIIGRVQSSLDGCLIFF